MFFDKLSRKISELIILCQ